jgi:hypothetical protein
MCCLSDLADAHAGSADPPVVLQVLPLLKTGTQAWQPSDFLPASNDPDFEDKVRCCCCCCCGCVGGSSPQHLAGAALGPCSQWQFMLSAVASSSSDWHGPSGYASGPGRAGLCCFQSPPGGWCLLSVIVVSDLKLGLHRRD